MLNIENLDYSLIIRTAIKILAAASFIFAIASSVLTSASAKSEKEHEYLLRSAREIFSASLITKYTFLAMIIGTFLLTDVSAADLSFFHRICFGYFILSIVILFVSISSKYISGVKKPFKSGSIRNTYSTIRNTSFFQISGFYILSLIFSN